MHSKYIHRLLNIAQTTALALSIGVGGAIALFQAFDATTVEALKQPVAKAALDTMTADEADSTLYDLEHY